MEIESSIYEMVIDIFTLIGQINQLFRPYLVIIWVLEIKSIASQFLITVFVFLLSKRFEFRVKFQKEKHVFKDYFCQGFES